ncbi:RsfA family transcription factor [Anoxybacillus tepidamans]|uniref:RsfA family transcription factor n=1 Tax=Anoxybacteroides tepidamans TaxID=265948 RepID=A0A7W8MU35_9BACL|nr:RsfA family transcriptional regulator [Anoxybacillus tepidamans]MBB5323789.1 RsfA family transcription factor [Anoxybacillus tepidamans]
MTSVRQDAWTQDEDLLLAEVVLRYIREGGTQLQAFEEVGRRLSRTAAACGFRWNSYVRKQYKEAIELAKKQRKEKKKEWEQLEQKEESMPEEKTAKLTWQDIIAFLQSHQQSSSQYQHVVDENRALKRDMEQLQQMITKLQMEKEQLQKELKAVQEDYQTLIGIMERARKMVVLEEEEQAKKVKLQMERNGNFEKIEK